MLNLYRKWKRKKTIKTLQREELKKLPQRIAFYGQFIKEGDLVFDIGANEGNRIQPFLDLKSKVIAVEPQPECISILNKKYSGKIILEPIALGSKPGKKKMYLADVSTISTLSEEFIQKTKVNRFKKNNWSETIEVELSTLDYLIKKHGKPLFCKIDVEGYEAEVLKGLTEPIPWISFEYCVPEMSGQLITCIEIIHKLNANYRFNYSISETMKFALPEFISMNEFLPILKSKDFINTLFGDIYCKI